MSTLQQKNARSRSHDDDSGQDDSPNKRHKSDNDHNQQSTIEHLDPCIRLLASQMASQEENIGCVRLTDLLYHDDLERIVQFNFTVDLEYLMENVHPKVRTKIPITVIHGHRHEESKQDIQREARNWPNVRLISPYIRDQYGTHHTKAMLLFFNKNGNKSVRLVISTANLCQDDWESMTQGIYQTSHCPLKTNTSTNQGTTVGSECGSRFERDLLNYLDAYGASLRDIRDFIRQYDWSDCKGILIGSVPGYHRGEQTMRLWGLQRLANVLKSHVSLDPECVKDGSTIIAQCSSVGSLRGKWFQKDFSRCMSEATNASSANTPEIKFMYPTVDEVSKSHNGIVSSAGFLRLEDGVYRQSKSWLDNHLCKWVSVESGRQKVMPHIKTYTRVYGWNNIAWHLLTSANLSRAAWGEFQKENTQLYIKSFELGVFICPSLFETSDHSNIQMLAATIQVPRPIPIIPSHDKEDPVTAVVPIRLPYDLPIETYGSQDKCYTRQYSQDACVQLFGAYAASQLFG